MPQHPAFPNAKKQRAAAGFQGKPAAAFMIYLFGCRNRLFHQRPHGGGKLRLRGLGAAMGPPLVE